MLRKMKLSLRFFKNFRYKFMFFKKNAYILLFNFNIINLYILLPHNFFLKKKKGQLYILNYVPFNNKFFIKFKNYLMQFSHLKFKKVLIKGVGIKFNLVYKNSQVFLELKLGYTHLVILPIPLSLKIYITKKSIFVESYNNILLGNFIFLLQNCKKFNIFTGKGLWLKGKMPVLKEFRKIKNL